MYNKVELCGVNTAELPILSEQEKRDLLTRARAGDKEARQSMIEGNLRLVLSVVQRFSQRGENMDDLFQVGCIGLIKAIDNFDINQNVRFSTYAVPMIIGEIRRYLRDNNSMRVSRSIRDVAYHAMQEKEKLVAKLGRDPTVEEIAKAMNMKKEEIVLALEAIVEPVSLYEPVFSDGGDTIYVMDQLGDSGDDGSWLDEIIVLREYGRKNLAGAGRRKYFNLRFLKRQDSDGSGRRDRHFAGAGLADSKRETIEGNKKKQQSVISKPGKSFISALNFLNDDKSCD